MGKRRNPGEETGRRQVTGTGHSFYGRAAIYRPGILFLYNIQTRKQYRIETLQADSEILLVEGDTVYYLTNKRLWRAKLGEKTFVSQTILVENDLVPDIHWAFLGPAVPAPTTVPSGVAPRSR